MLLANSEIETHSMVFMEVADLHFLVLSYACPSSNSVPLLTILNLVGTLWVSCERTHGQDISENRMLAHASISFFEIPCGFFHSVSMCPDTLQIWAEVFSNTEFGFS